MIFAKPIKARAKDLKRFMEFSIDSLKPWQKLINPTYSCLDDFLDEIVTPVIMTPCIDANFSSGKYFILIDFTAASRETRQSVSYFEVMGYGPIKGDLNQELLTILEHAYSRLSPVSKQFFERNYEGLKP